MRLALLLTGTLLAAAFNGSPLAAQDDPLGANPPRNDAAEPSEPSEAAERNRFDFFLESARKYVIRQEGRDEPLELHERSLQNWVNPIRQQQYGSVFVWLEDGRPAVIGSMFVYPFGNRVGCKHALHSLSQSPLRTEYDDRLAWSPRKPGVEWKAVKDGPSPASNERQRLIQLRQIARRFNVTLESEKEGKTRLRLIPQPLFRYDSAAQNVRDGAIFSFALATDPEALLLVELLETSGQPQWRYAFARFHYYQLTATDQFSQVIWTAKEDLSLERNPLGNPDNLEKTYNSFQSPDVPDVANLVRP